MNNEIKKLDDLINKLEIRDLLEDLQKCIDDGQYEQTLKIEHIKLLLDCITNLQQKVNQYENPDDMTLFYMWLDEKAKDKMKSLQQEVEEQKDMLSKYRHLQTTTGIDELMGENAKLKQEKDSFEKIANQNYKVAEDYKSRNDKAIEYIRENKDKYYQDWGEDDGSYDTYLGEYEIDKVLSILQGVLNENSNKQ